MSDKLYEIQTRGFKNVLFNTPSITFDEKAITIYNKAIERGADSQESLAIASKNTNQATIALMQSANGATITQEQLTAAQNASTLAARLQSKAFKALSVAGNMILFTVIAKGVQLATTALDNWINRSKYAVEAMEKAQQSINDAQNKLKNVSSAINENKDRFLELSEGVDKFSKNIKLSEEDYAEYLSISNKLAEISPELVTGYTEQGDALLHIGDNAEETSEKLNKILEAEKAIAKQTLVDNIDNVAHGIYYEVEEANSDIANLKSELNTVSTVYRDIKGIIKDVDDDASTIDFGTGSGLNLDFDEMEQLKNAIRNSGAKITEDEVFDTMLFSSSEVPLVQKAIEDFYKQIDFTRKNESAAYINGITKDIQEQENAIKDIYAKMAPNLAAWAKSTYEYDFLNEQKQKLIESLIPTLNWNDIQEKTGMAFFSGTDYEQYIKDNIIVPLMSIPDEYQGEVDKKFAKLLAFDANDINIVDYVSELQEYLDSIGITIDLKPLIDHDTVETKKRFDNSLRKIFDDHGMTDKKAYEDAENGYAKILEYTDNLTPEQKELWITATDGTHGAIEAIHAFEEALAGAQQAASFEDAWASSFTSENDTVKELGNNLLDLAEKGRLTVDTFNKADSTDYFKNLGISADEAVSKINKLVDESSQLSSMSSQISPITNALGTKREEGFVNADTLSGFAVEIRGLDSWDRFQTVLGSTASSYEECQEAANALATEWVNNSDFLSQLTQQNKEYYETQLKAMGIENYEEVIAYAQELNSAKEALAQAGFDAADATADEVQELINEGVYSELAQQCIWKLVLAKQTESGITLNSSADCQNLLALAQNAGVTGDAITLLMQLLEIYNNLAAGTYGTNAQVINAVKNQAANLQNQINNLLTNDTNTTEIDPIIKVNPSSLSHAGRSAGASYVDAFEKELDNLKESRDQGKITEKEYLDYLRKLYQHFFRDKKKYAKEYDKYEQEYLQGMKSLYESALSGITSILDKQINAYEDSKSAAVDSLEAERDARIEVLEAQKDQYEEQIKLIEKQIEEKESMIDDINEEIDAIREANEERQRQLTLQEKQIALERMLNQRSILQYSADKGMHYVQDTDGIRGARQELDDAKTEMVIADKEKQISLIEKEIGLLEDRKDSINEQIELIDTQIDQINSQYDKMISNTEKYWDGLISGMESYKSRWQELAEIEEQAKLVSMLEQLGLNADEILNMSEASFVRFKDEYMGILADIYADNSSMLAGLSEASGRSVEELGSYLQATQGYIDGLSGIGESLNPAAEAINNVDSSMSTLAGSASAVNEQTSGIASGMSDLGGSTAAVSDNLNSIKTALMELPEADKFLAIAEAFRYLAGALQYVSSVLGAAGEEGQGGLAAQFGSLKSAIDQVTSAIGGGIGNNTDTEGLPSSEIGGSQTNGAQGGASLSKAFSDLQKTAAKAIGKEGNEGDGTVIGTFGSLKGTITDVANTIGFSESEEEDGEKTGGDEDSASLTTSITGLQSTTEETLGDPGGNGVIGRFEQFKNVLGEASEHVQSIPKGLAAIDGKEVECTIKVNIETNGSLPAGIGHGMKLYSKLHEAKLNGSANAAGTALVTGSWAVQSAQRHTLVGELGRELIVRDGRFFTVGNYGAEFVDIQKGDIVFNHKQTEHLLKNGYITGRGKAYADGTIGDPLACGKYSPIHPYGYTAQLQKAFDPLVRRLLAGEEKIMNNAFAGEPGQMEKTIREMNASNIFDKSTHPDVHVDGIHISCPGVTSTEVARQVGAELNHMFNGFHNYADQQSLIR